MVNSMHAYIEKLKNLPGPESIHRKVFANGITLLTFSNFHTHSVDIVGMLDVGAAADPKDKLGLAHFVVSMLSRGTQKKDFQTYHDLLESHGASLTFSCGDLHSWLRGKALAEDAEMLIALAAESVRQPAFPSEYVERLRSQLIANLAIRDEDTAEVASMLFDRALFPSHPYGEPADGFVETIQTITKNDLLSFHSSYFKPQGMVLAVAGALESTEISHLVEKYFGEWENPQAADFALPPIPPPPQSIIRKHRLIEEKSQTDLQIGAFAPPRISKDYLPVYLGNNILGQFGLMGRIGESVRSKSGLAYHASSSINSWEEAGTWEFYAGLNPKNLQKVIDLIREEIRRFIEEPVTDEELSDSKSHLIGRLPLSLESNIGIANAIITIERFNLGLDYYQHYPSRIQSITANQILEASRKYLHPDKLVIASAGEGKNIE